MPHKPLVLVSSNRKGGCGKTSTVLHTGGEFARRGNRTLLVDCDPQASLSQSVRPFGSSIIESFPPERSVVALFDDHMDPAPENIIHESEFENVWIIPACDALTRFNHPEVTEHGFLQDSLRHLVAEVREHFDVVLIDTPPNLQMLTWAGLVSADHCITPCQPEDFSSQGIRSVRKFVETAQATRNGDLRWMGILLTMVQPRLAVHQVYEQVLRDAYAGLVIDSQVPLSVQFKEAVASKSPITLWKKPTNQAGKSIVALVDEILSRTAASHSGLKTEVPKPVRKSRAKKTSGLENGATNKEAA